ncbi:MAG: inorganic diphosphatase [Alphaproteobacteria bacterium]|nr:inorganic diphosphatase [Alphaproteobacteria bacterium]MDD9920025.1 inorganic diphosphatase [Alphaproteobacteria bacterium]
MSLLNVPAGKDAPEDIYVIVENTAHSYGVKYEVDKDTGTLFVDRFAPMPMVFPAHYGFINKTLGGDGDPVDAFIYTDIPVVPGSVVRCRPIAVLRTEDESGDDPKLICVPVTKLDRRFANTNSINDLPELFKHQMEQFYANYKNLEEGKWVKTNGWGDAAEAKDVIREGIANCKG